MKYVVPSLLRNLGGPAAFLFGRLALCRLVLLFVVLLGRCRGLWVLWRTTAGPLRDINLALGFGLMKRASVNAVRRSAVAAMVVDVGQK